VALIGCCVSTFRDNLSAPSSRVKLYSWITLPLKMELASCPEILKGQAVQQEFFLECLTLEGGTDRLSRNVGTRAKTFLPHLLHSLIILHSTLQLLISLNVNTHRQARRQCSLDHSGDLNRQKQHACRL
jgi:hypothetical protein